ncbi:MAG: DNA-binding protein [Actinobacteria bacterium]|jgi:uncharacterized protein|uniref:Unannotated protein n=1 Tax=freshwater metagenome TaxID=449393 RepID=A0A6J7AGS7_9ZZZZ|nr:DNA-binding protein [Actinomycetota bacterium]MSW90405.1 DNA-binding protein [Actinomycetota bacterium]MSX87317.1 DNA-binding protein [Actinomycetota bacterium]MSY70531.1 DNA-binding protein [Actinomycetota bacterium]
MTEWTKPLPHPTPLSQPFWDGTKEREIRLQRCDACGAHRFPPLVLCRVCLAEEHQWVPTSARGTLYSYVIQHRPATPAFIDDLPYVVAIVELDEGPLMLTNIVGCEIDALEVGMRVEATYFDASDDITLYPFTPSKE